MSSDYLKSRYTNLSSLTVSRDPTINRQKVLELVDFYVVGRPRVAGAAGSTPQSFELSQLDWDKDSVRRKAEDVLFDGKRIERVPDGRAFARQARKRGFVTDKRLLDKKKSALLTQGGKTVAKRGTARFVESECIADCLFRHVRNSIAHGNMFNLRYGWVLFLDKTNSGAFSAYVITTPFRLYELMLDLKKGR